MAGTPGFQTPVWRTLLAKTLAVWMVIALVSFLAAARLTELLPVWAFSAFIVMLYLVAPVALLAWSTAMLIRRPRVNWPALAALLTCCVGLFASERMLFDAGVHLNFLSHRSAYDRIVADARFGRLDGSPDATGRMSGERDGIRYIVDRRAPLELEFVWSREDSMMLSVIYDERGCPRPPAPPQRPSAKAPTAVQRAGASHHLADHYCLIQGIA